MKFKYFSYAIFAVFISALNLPDAYAGPLYTFTTAGASGINGPTNSQVTSAYASTNLAGAVTVATQGIQQWTVPTSGEYVIEAAGASGGYTPGALGGKGRVIKIRLNLTAGTQLKIVVGQEGGRAQFTTGYAGGGGGGTFVYNVTSSTWILVAGGGGGAGQGDGVSRNSTQAGVDAAVYSSTSGTAGTGYSGSYWAAGAGGTSGGGGLSNSGGAAGAGISSNGANGGYSGIGGKSWANNLVGGSAGIAGSTTEITAGGFGGGGGASVLTNYEALGGGGGGYSGGGGSATRVGAGGGGGNYYTGTYLSSSLNTGNGFATFQIPSDPTVSLATSGDVRMANKGKSLILTATVDDTVRITFFADGKRIPGCFNLLATSGTKQCSWKPAIQGNSQIYAAIYQSGTQIATSARISINIIKRGDSR